MKVRVTPGFNALSSGVGHVDVSFVGVPVFVGGV